MKSNILIILLILTTSTIQSQSIKDILTTEEKIYGLSTVWSEVTNNFVFLDKLDLDFDSLYKSTIPKVIKAKDNFEYIHVMREFMNKLNDKHTGIMYSQFYWNGGDYPPVFLTFKEDKFLVKKIAKEYISKIPLGSELLNVDGIPYPKYKEISPSGNLFSYVKSTVLLEFKTPKGKIIEQAFTRNFNHLYRGGNPIEMVEEKDNQNQNEWREYQFSELDGYSLIEINTFETDTVVKQFQKDIPKINKSKGLILDVRNNGGGNSEYSKGIAQHIVQKDILIGPMWKTRLNNAAKKAWGSMAIYGFDDEWTKSNEKYWKNNAWEINSPDTTKISSNVEKIVVPIKILMGEKTFSAAEDFLIYTMGNHNIIKIGQNSAGSSGQPMLLQLPGGIYARICSKRDALPNGEDYIGIGIKPDIEISKQEDAIEFAINELKKK